jgi:hypothetical protein
MENCKERSWIKNCSKEDSSDDDSSENVDINRPGSQGVRDIVLLVAHNGSCFDVPISFHSF